MRLNEKWSFDARCKDLAEHFLSGGPHDDREVFELAQAIQDAIEMWFIGRTDPFEPQRS